jgi:hypothetical protein
MLLKGLAILAMRMDAGLPLLPLLPERFLSRLGRGQSSLTDSAIPCRRNLLNNMHVRSGASGSWRPPTVACPFPSSSLMSWEQFEGFLAATPHALVVRHGNRGMVETAGLACGLGLRSVRQRGQRGQRGRCHEPREAHQYTAEPVLVSGFCVTTDATPPHAWPNVYRDGKDGPWSTFRIEVGTPPQQIRVLPASSQSSTWVVLPEACATVTGNECPKDRGRTYLRNESSSWKEYGSYELNTFLEKRVGLNGDGLYGYEKLTLGWTGDGLPGLEGQMIAGIISEDFYIGSVSLNPRPNNFTDYNNPVPSLLQSLRNSSTPIPSTTWSYTAGSNNLAPKVFGSLVLGGHDTTRFTPNDVVFPFGADISLDFQVAIQSIKTNTMEKPLLSTGIISYIDTLVADIWLPTRTCKLFEEAFGLVWDDRTELYLLNETLHDSLLERNPTVTFKLGPQTSGAAVSIDLPYFNFYQTATSAYVGNSSGLYFPLKRAANETQYVLGRAFLQSAYLTADYDRNTFSLSQALFPPSTASASVVAILPPSATEGGGRGQGNESSGSRSALSVGVIAGIAAGGVVVIAVIAAAIFIFLRRKRKTKAEEAHELADTDVQHTARHEAPGEDLKHEVGEGLRHEVTGDSHQKIELYAEGEQQKAAEIDATERRIYEMPADEIKKPIEMEGEGYEGSEVHGHSAPLGGRRATDASERPVYEDDDRSPLTPPTDRTQRHG